MSDETDELHIMDTGDVGRLQIVVSDDKTVSFWLQSTSPVAVPQLPWTFTLAGVKRSWKSFNLDDTTAWQRLGGAYLGDLGSVTLHLGNTGTTQLGGPTDFLVEFEGGVGAVDIQVGDEIKKAIPYICVVPGVWKPATPYANDKGAWKPTV